MQHWDKEHLLKGIIKHVLFAMWTHQEALGFKVKLQFWKSKKKEDKQTKTN